MSLEFATRPRRATRTVTAEPPAIVFGGDVSGLAVIRSMGRGGVPVFSAGTATTHLTRSRWYRPVPGEPLEETTDRRRLAEYLRGLPFSEAVLIPASDDWALALASLPDDVTSSYPATVAPRPVVRTLVDKERFAAAAERHDVPTPRTISVTGVESLDDIDDADLPRFFLKPVNSQRFARRFGVKALRLDGRHDAAELVRRAVREDCEVVLQEFIPGEATAHVFLDGYVDRDGAMRALLARRRLRMYPADFGNSTLSVTIPMEEVSPALESLRRLFDGIGFTGFFDAEFKQDARDGRFKIFEVNARPWWQLELAEAAGLGVCSMAYRDALGLPLPDPPDPEVGQTWVHPLPDLKAWWKDRLKGGIPIRTWLGGANAVFAPDDPMPGLEQAGRALLSRVRSRRG